MSIMRMLQKVAAAGVLALALTGCGSLNVQVSALNPRVIEAESDRQIIRNGLPLVAGQTMADVRAKVREYQQAHFDFVSELAESYLAEANERTDPAEKDLLSSLGNSLQGNFAATMGPYYEDVEVRLVAVTEAIQILSKQDGQEAKLASHLQMRDQILKNLRARVKKEINKDVEGVQFLNEVRQQVVAGKLQTFNEKRAGLPGQSIKDDPFAYAVASAPNKLWAQKFNRAYGRGFMGNLNMAVKLEESGSYVIKGLTFDPSDVARIASKVTTQALLIATQVAGVPSPIAPPANAPAGAALATSSKALAEAEKFRAQQNMLLLSHKDALRSLAGTILREWPSLDNDDAAKRKAGIAAIRSGFTANKARLRMENAPASPAPTPATDDDDDDEDEDEE